MELPKDLEQWVSKVRATGCVQGRTGRRIPVHPVGIDDQQGLALRDYVISEGASRTLETGMGVGISCAYICSGLSAIGHPERSHCAIDPYQSDVYDDAGVEAVKELGFEPIVEVLSADSSLALPTLVQQGQLYDAAFIDGDHRFEGVFLDLIYCFRLIRPGGLIIADDHDLPAVAKSVRYACKNLSITLESTALRLAVLRKPTETQPPRPWDHYVDF